MSIVNTTEKTVAVLFGQPVTEIPHDLFIPPDALQVVLQSFEGPLDLLLYLIRKQNIDVLDIPMLTVTEQYLSYIHQMQQHELDLTAEYLLMAAVLIEIKTRLLLPTPPASEEEVVDPRAELVRRLLAYEQMKLAAAELDALPRAGRDFAWAWLPVELVAVTQPPQVQVADLTRAWLAILARSQNNRSHNVVKETLSVRAQMSAVLRHLQTRQHCYFTELFGRNDSLAMVVTTFIAVLELAKEGLVYITQHSTEEPITIQTAGVEAGSDLTLINKSAS
ncbi:segregation and condensation protein A [Snodgrassella gandavensis]|uniref:segregation and condensation protein A n=1 Tax=Snodgrassella gandavensis TaxID=2946698 RepID=UPI001EF5F716|nr:ScpA family protein [Snodgrassella gandavensis]